MSDADFPTLRASVALLDGSQKRRRIVTKSPGSIFVHADSNPVEPAWPQELHFERQQEARCGLHALNHVVGVAAFTVADMDSAVQDILDEAAAFATAQKVKSSECASNHKSAHGYYSEQVMSRVLEKTGCLIFDQTPLHLQDGFETNLWGDGVRGAVIHTPGHWMALRCADEQLWLLDSLAPAPRYMGRRGDERIARSLERYSSIFLVRGLIRSDPPGVPSPPLGESSAVEHQAASLAISTSDLSGVPSPPLGESSAAEPQAVSLAITTPGQQLDDAHGTLSDEGVADTHAAVTAHAPGQAHQPTLPGENASGADEQRRFVAEDFGQGRVDVSAHQRRFMAEDFGQERVDADVRALLQLYMDSAASSSGPLSLLHSYVLSLPLFAETSSLSDLTTEFDQAVQMLCRDEVNSTAALQVRPCLARTMTYPLLVLLHATALSQGIPTVFSSTSYMR